MLRLWLRISLHAIMAGISALRERSGAEHTAAMNEKDKAKSKELRDKADSNHADAKSLSKSVHDGMSEKADDE